MNSVLKIAWYEWGYKTTKIRTTWFWWMKISKDGFTNTNLKKLRNMEPIWISDWVMDSKWNKWEKLTIKNLEDYLVKNITNPRTIPLLHEQWLARKITPDFFRNLAIKTLNSK